MTVTTRTRIMWAVVAGIGFAAGATVSSVAVNPVARLVSPLLGGLVSVALYGAVIGGIAGLVQLAVIPRDEVRWHAWLAANIAGFAVGYVMASVVGEALGNAIDPRANIVLAEAAIEISAGAALGLAVGLAQWRALHQVDALPRLRWWLVATAIGVGLGYGSAAGVLEELQVAVLKANLIPSFAAIVGLGMGLAQAIALRTRSRPASHPR